MGEKKNNPSAPALPVVVIRAVQSFFWQSQARQFHYLANKALFGDFRIVDVFSAVLHQIFLRQQGRRVCLDSPHYQNKCTGQDCSTEQP